MLVGFVALLLQRSIMHHKPLMMHEINGIVAEAAAGER